MHLITTQNAVVFTLQVIGGGGGAGGLKAIGLGGLLLFVAMVFAL